MDRIPLVVFSHLRWDFVYQRPQHVMSRLAAYRPVLFVEEPIVNPGKMALEVEAVAPGVRVARPIVPIDGAPFGSAQETAIISLLRSRLAADDWKRVVTWLYTPMAVRVAKGLHPVAIIYDCMDDLSGFLGAPEDLLAKDRELLAAADAVMTGGPSLWKLKKERHAYVHCFPSSVDVEHFQSASDAEEPSDQAHLPSPRLGYYGVIDERMDLDILAALAEAHPDWQIVMVGPVVKIDPATLPKAPNIHYLGRKDYSELPAHLAGWDVALIPFARNSATRYVSPTKILEYMAADKLIVSSSIADVAEPYADIVFLGDTPEEFVHACESALGCSEIERATRRARARRVLSRTSWNDTAKRMDEIVQMVTMESPSPGLAVAGAGAS